MASHGMSVVPSVLAGCVLPFLSQFQVPEQEKLLLLASANYEMTILFPLTLSAQTDCSPLVSNLAFQRHGYFFLGPWLILRAIKHCPWAALHRWVAGGSPGTASLMVATGLLGIKSRLCWALSNLVWWVGTR